MVKFKFKVNRSFLDMYRHPITIPKVTYSDLESEGLKGNENVTVTLANRVLGEGIIYAGKAGFGPYYQVRMRRLDSPNLLDSLDLGTTLEAEMHRMNNSWVVRLRVAYDQAD